MIQVIRNSGNAALQLTVLVGGGGGKNLQKLYRILLYVDRREVPTTVPRIPLYVDRWGVPITGRILLYVDSRGVPTTGPYPSFCGQSGSPHNSTVSFFLWTVGKSPQLDRRAKQISITAAGQKQVQLPQRGFSSEHWSWTATSTALYSVCCP